MTERFFLQKKRINRKKGLQESTGMNKSGARHLEARCLGLREIQKIKKVLRIS
jgi:hypothetical protein